MTRRLDTNAYVALKKGAPRVEDLVRSCAHLYVSLALLSRITADRFGRIATHLKRAGTPIPTNDIWIAAQAMELGSELISFDAHFERVPGLVFVHPAH